MLVVFVMHMGVLVLHRLVLVQMVVALGKMQIQADAHQHGRAEQLRRYGFAEQRDADCRPDERRGGKIRTRARSPHMPQSNDEEDQADAITQQSNDTGGQHTVQAGQARAEQ